MASSENEQSVEHSRSHLHKSGGGSARIAEAAVAGMGSLRFIAIQTVVIIAWITLNVVALVHHWDVYPYILLNLLFSTQAAYAAPLVLLAGNRSAAKDRLRDDLEAQETATILGLVQAIHGLASEIHQMDIDNSRHIQTQPRQVELLEMILSNVQAKETS